MLSLVLSNGLNITYIAAQIWTTAKDIALKRTGVYDPLIIIKTINILLRRNIVV